MTSEDDEAGTDDPTWPRAGDVKNTRAFDAPSVGGPYSRASAIDSAATRIINAREAVEDPRDYDADGAEIAAEHQRLEEAPVAEQVDQEIAGSSEGARGMRASA
jgi:hypothetical protein